MNTHLAKRPRTDATVVDRYQLDVSSQEGAVRRAEVIGWQYPCYENSHWHVSGRLRTEGPHQSLTVPAELRMGDLQFQWRAGLL